MDYYAPPDTLFRVVKSDPPTINDFMSRQDRGLPPLDPDHADLNDGVSALDSEGRARDYARRMPWLGDFIAEFWMPEDCTAESSLGPGHYTVRGPAEALLSAVARVVPVR